MTTISCSQCSKSFPSTLMYCPYCGTTIENLDDPFTEESNNNTNQEIENEKEIKRQAKKEFGHLFWLSFLLPLIGLIMGAIYTSKDNKKLTYIGKGCIEWATVSILLSITIAILYYAYNILSQPMG